MKFSGFLVFVGIPAIVAASALASCEDDPLLAPQSGGKETNGSYGSIAVAPPVDTTRATAGAPKSHPENPEIF